MMDTPPASIRDLARRLVAAEGARPPGYDQPAHEAARVCETLRVSMSRFAGPDGFTALLRRSLTLAEGEVPRLRGVQVKADGSLDGFDALFEAEAAGLRTEAAVAITAHLLGLLVTFIGEPLTLRLVREAWPEAPLAESE
jgi:hypothetical protein